METFSVVEDALDDGADFETLEHRAQLPGDDTHLCVEPRSAWRLELRTLEQLLGGRQAYLQLS